MNISDEDKLILNGEMFFSIRKHLQQKKCSAEIIAKLEEILNEGADINACDNNDNNNTVLHIAAQKGDKDVVLYLLQKGAHLFRNKHGQTALDLALQANQSHGKEIATILSENGKHVTHITSENSRDNQAVSKQKLHSKSILATVTDQEITYSKRAGTSGVSGQFYETKLLSLVLHRALHDQEIESFYLAANIRDIGDFDDVCFRHGNVACFMQTKHRENTDKAKLTVASVRSSTGKLGLGIYFDSFLKIRQKFSINSRDPMFQGKFEDIDTYFVLYTPLKENFDRKLSNNKQICNKLHDIINTGAKETNKSLDIFQFDYESSDLDFLTSFIKYERLRTLAKTFLEFVLSNKKLEVMMTNDLIKVYHPALAQKVVIINKVLETSKTPKNPKLLKNQSSLNESSLLNYIHIGSFRPEFFYSEDHHLRILKDTFFQEIVLTHSSKTGFTKDELEQRIQDIYNNPCAETISILIGCPLKFDDTTDKLSIDINKLPKNKYKQEEIKQIRYKLQKIQVTRTMIRDAVYIAGEKKLKSLTFQLPQSFGNIDLTTNKKTEEDEHNRLNFLVEKFLLLIDYFAERNKDKETKIIDISSDVVGPRKILELTHLSSNGGIGGAVGNLLEFDSQTELFKFKTKGVLNKNAKYVLEKLRGKSNGDISNYKINVLIDSFPRVTFDTYKFDRSIAADFLSKLWFYTNQAQEESVETTLKKEINIHYNADKQRKQFLFHVHSDAIFLRFHDEIQKWWKKQTEASYITKRTTIFENAKKDIVDNPLLTVLNVMFIRRIKNICVNFNEVAIDCLNLDELLNSNKANMLNIVSDAVILSAAKVMQCKKYTNNYSFINLDYANILPEDDRKIMMKELGQENDMTLVIISETPLEQSAQNTLLEIYDNFKPLDPVKKQIIIITDKPIKNYQSEMFKSNDYDAITINDNNVNFIDLTSQSQSIILNNCTITYQGQEVKLNMLIDENAKELINSKFLWALLNKEKVEVGLTLHTQKYNEIKKYYIDRNLKRDGEDYAVNTLDDLDERIILISSKPCMGKSVLLTHLSLESKKTDPKPWIVRIDLSFYDKNIEKLKHNKDINSIMAYLCKSALRNPNEIKKGYFMNIDNEKVYFRSTYSAVVSFELLFFIHCYNSGNIIFLFDGFDKIYPQYTDEGFKLFKTIEQANKRMWITSDCYVINILEDKFGKAYNLERLSTLQQKSFLQRFWSTNLQLEKLNHDQFNNITIFMDYIFRTFNKKTLNVNEGVEDRIVMPMFSVPLHILYLTVLEYFKDDLYSLSPCYFREKIKEKWRLNSFTAFDHYLRAPDNEQSLTLTGTPLHMYIAANYFIFQVTDKFDLHLNTDTIRDRADIYYDALSLYQQFLNANIKQICEIESNTTAHELEKSRNQFFETHKKLALYAIFKESDIVHILTEPEIREVKNTIKMIESGAIKTHLIDSVVAGVPRFYHFLFAEYFAVEALADFLKRMKNQDFDDVKLDSIWNLIVNIVLCASPPSFRHIFEYKLKYDPDLSEAANNKDSKKIIFNILLKKSQPKDDSVDDTANALNIAINEGLVNVTNLLIKCVRSNDNEEKFDKLFKIVKGSASILEGADSSRSILSENILQAVKNVDGETITNILKSPVVQESVKEKIVKPVIEITENLREASNSNENLALLIEKIPYLIRQFSKK